jgi:predicted peroxiredoxin
VAAGESDPLKSAWGSDDPTKASFAFLHANAFTELSHEVQIFLLGEAVNAMRDEVANAIVPVGWPPLKGTLATTLRTASAPHMRSMLAGP